MDAGGKGNEVGTGSWKHGMRREDQVCSHYLWTIYQKQCIQRAIAAQIAEQKANGLWIDNKALAVKSAIYGKEQAEIKWRQPDHREKFVVRKIWR
ncbi:hypothetical protein ACSBR1_039288 [Camellia fascicularis]